VNVNSISILDQISENIERTRTLLVVRPSSPSEAALELQLPVNPTNATPLIASFLYAHYYACDPNLWSQQTDDQFSLLGLRLSDRDFLGALKNANPGSGYYNGGWLIVDRYPDGKIIIRKDGVTLVAQANRHLMKKEREARPGEMVAVRFPKDSVMASPGYYVAYSNAGPAVGSNLTRIYLNLRAKYAAEVTHQILHRLQPMYLPYSFKVLTSPSRFRRRDAAVLFIRRANYNVVMPHILSVHNMHSDAFCPDIPSFTLYIRDGVAVADNPQTDSTNLVSFGEHRTWLMAEAICQIANGKKPVNKQTTKQAIMEQLSIDGVDLKRPHLAAVTAEDYFTFSYFIPLAHQRGGKHECAS
jgi:hypothetical protein